MLFVHATTVPSLLFRNQEPTIWVTGLREFYTHIHASKHVYLYGCMALLHSLCMHTHVKRYTCTCRKTNRHINADTCEYIIILYVYIYIERERETDHVAFMIVAQSAGVRACKGRSSRGAREALGKGFVGAHIQTPC